MKPKKLTAQKRPTVDGSYIDVILLAASLHGPCAKIPSQIRAALECVCDADIRRPNDWQFEYTGIVTFRWYDGPGDSLSGSTRSVSLFVCGDKCGVRGHLDKSYRTDGAVVTINGLPSDKAVAILKILVDVIDGRFDGNTTEVK